MPDPGDFDNHRLICESQSQQDPEGSCGDGGCSPVKEETAPRFELGDLSLRRSQHS